MAWSFFTSTGDQKKLQTSARVSRQTGIITSFAGSSAPTGWLLCQGQEVSRTTYPELAQLLGDTYGSFTNGSGASGTTHFRLPDLRGRAVAGVYAGAGDNGTGTGAITGTSLNAVKIGFWQGTESVTLSASQSGMAAHTHNWSGGDHKHTLTSSGHTHNNGPNYSSIAVGDSGGGTVYQGNSGSSINSTSTTPTITVSSTTTGITINNFSDTSASSSHENMQPSLAINFIIKI